MGPGGRDPKHRPEGGEDPLDRLEGAPPGVTPEMLEAQYRSMRESLEASVEQRIEDFARARGPVAGAAGRAGRGQRVLGTLGRFRPELYLLVTLGLFGVLWLRGGDGPAAGEGTVEAPPQAQGDGPPASPRPAERAGPSTAPVDAQTLAAIRESPDAAWARLVAEHRDAYARALRAVAGAEGLDDAAVSDLQKANFARWADLAEGTGEIPENVLRNTRTGLFEYVYGRAEHDLRGRSSPGFRVTLAYSAYDASTLRALLEDLGLEGAFGDSPDPQDPALRTAVVAGRIFRP